MHGVLTSKLRGEESDMTTSVAHELPEKVCLFNDGERDYTVTAKTTSEARMKKKVQQRLPGLVCKCTSTVVGKSHWR